VAIIFSPNGVIPGSLPFQRPWGEPPVITGGAHSLDRPEIAPEFDVDVVQGHMGFDIRNQPDEDSSCDILRSIGMDIGMPRNEWGTIYQTRSELQVIARFTREGIFHTDATWGRIPESSAFLRLWVEEYSLDGSSFIRVLQSRPEFIATIALGDFFGVNETLPLAPGERNFQSEIVVEPNRQYRLYIDLVGHIAANNTGVGSSNATAALLIRPISRVSVEFILRAGI
jgi:hypothetical protein